MISNVWDYKRRGWAAKYLKRWFRPPCAVHADRWATHSRLKPLRDFAWMLRRHEEGILAYFDIRIDNSIVEAMNNNAKIISHRSRGYRSENTFSLAMIHSLGGLPLPQYQHRFS
ncbi:MAG: transposase [Deltaproteobacteria bacterium]|nr:transposase [Deltaproteobacteria bacterium]MBW2027010.1 transposase [Deltaproteobacteria bacterium]